MSRIGGAAIVSEIRLNNSKLRRDAAESKGILRNLVRSVGTSSGPDPFVNAIGRLAPAAALALVGIKALEAGTNAYINSRDSASARLRGDLEAEIKLEKEWRDTLKSIPIAGPLGAAIREAFTGEEAALEAQKFQNKEDEKSLTAKQKKVDLINKAREGSEDLVRTIARENAAEGKSPRVKEIMTAIDALEDYKREAQKIADEANKGQLTQSQQEAIKALESRIEALRKKHGGAAFSDAVSAAQAAQIAILESEKVGAQKRVDVAKKEATDKKKVAADAQKGPSVVTDAMRETRKKSEVQSRVDRAESVVEDLRAQGATSGPRLRQALLEARRSRDIRRFGSATEGETRRQERSILEANVRQRDRETKELKEKQERERSRLTDQLRRDPTNESLRKVITPQLAELDERQKRQRESLSREQRLRTERAERRTSRVRGAREPVRKAEEKQADTPQDRPRMEFREGLRKFLGMQGKDEQRAPKVGEPGAEAAKKLGAAADKMDKAADKLSKTQTVGVIQR